MGSHTVNAKEAAAVSSPGKAAEYETLNANARSVQGGSSPKNPAPNNTAKKNGQSPHPGAKGKAGSDSSAGQAFQPLLKTAAGNSAIGRSWQSGQTQAKSPWRLQRSPARSRQYARPPSRRRSKARSRQTGGRRGCCAPGKRSPASAPPPALHTEQRGRKNPIESTHNENGDRQSGESPVLNEILKRADILFHTPVQPAKAGNNKRDIPRRVAASGVREEVPVYNPFPDAFPRSVWKRVLYPGTSRYYLEGEVVKDGARYMVHALPGEYGGGDAARQWILQIHAVGRWNRILASHKKNMKL